MIERIEKLTEQIKDNWSLCGLFSGFRHASEMEFITAETIHACKINHTAHGECFSIRGRIQDSGNGLVTNMTAYRQMLENSFLEESGRNISGKDIMVIIPTPKLLDKIESYFSRKGVIV